MKSEVQCLDRHNKIIHLKIELEIALFSKSIFSVLL